MKRVSVALATCRGARFLEAQLESLAAQSLPPFEVVVSDDASDDRTMEIVRSWAGRLPLRIQVNTERLGFRDNFFQAVELCSGDFIALCDQDDVWMPHKLERCVDRLEADGALLAMHTAAIVDEQLRPYGRVSQLVDGRTHEPGTLYPYPGQGFGLTLVFRRELARIVPPARRPAEPGMPDRLLTHDTWFLLVASIFGRVATIDEDLVLYRQHGANASGADALTAPSRENRPAAIAGAHHARSRYCREVADMLMGLPNLEDAIVAYERLARQYATRAAIYDEPSLLSRARAFADLARQGGYAFSLRGRMGLPAVARDLAVGVTRVLAH